MYGHLQHQHSNACSTHETKGAQHMAHDEHDDIIEDDPIYWDQRCGRALRGLRGLSLRPHHLSALAVLAEDIAAEVIDEGTQGVVSGRVLRLVR